MRGRSAPTDDSAARFASASTNANNSQLPLPPIGQDVNATRPGRRWWVRSDGKPGAQSGSFLLQLEGRVVIGQFEIRRLHLYFHRRRAEGRGLHDAHAVH
jgi:hypothetical protein